MSSRNQAAIAVVVFVLALVVALWWWGRAPEPPPPAAAPPTATHEPVEPTRTVAPPRAAATQTAAASALPPATPTSTPTPRPTGTPATYGSYEITEGLDPITTAREVTIGKSRENEPRLLAFPSNIALEAPNAIVIYAYLAEDIVDEETQERTLDSRRVPARDVRGELLAPDGTPLRDLDFRDDGKEGDAEANDHFFTAQYEPTPESAPDMSGRLSVVVRAKTAKGEDRVATTPVYYGVPAARLTGNYREELVDGHLRVLAEVDVDEGGVFDLQATLADNHAQFVGWAHNSVELQEGTHWIPITYSGRIFHSKNVPGPYLVWSLTITALSKDPPQRSDVLPNTIRTQPYTVHQFSNSEFQQ